MENTSDTRFTQCKNPIHPMHGSTWLFQKLRPLPKFWLRDQSTSGLDTWLGLTQRVTYKNLGTVPQGNMTYEFLKFPIVSLGENQPWRETCWLSGIRDSYANLVYKGENFSIFRSWAKNVFQTIFRTLVILTVVPPARAHHCRDSQNLFHQISHHLFLQWYPPPGNALNPMANCSHM